MPLSSIGSYTVLHMHPAPQPARQGTQVESRAGVENVAVWLTAIRGKEYQVETVIDVASWANAITLCGLYYALVGSGPVEIVFGGVACGNVQVLDVTAVPEAALGHGGTCGVSLAIVRAQWRLIAV